MFICDTNMSLEGFAIIWIHKSNHELTGQMEPSRFPVGLNFEHLKFANSDSICWSQTANTSS